MASKPYPVGDEKKFNKFLVEEYLKAGSVDEVFAKFKQDLPISYAGYQRVLDKKEIVKAAGPNNRLGEALDFITKLVYENIPFEKLYKMMPLSFKTSAASLYRILAYIKEGVTRRTAAALIITKKGKKGDVLVAKDISTPRIELGKDFGLVTIPMGFSRRGDLRREAVLRILQSEVFAKLAVEGKNLGKLIPKDIKPFMYLDIVDVRVEVYHLEISKKDLHSLNFSSFKLKNFHFVGTKKLESAKNLRVGVREAVEGYEKYIHLTGRKLTHNPIQSTAKLNAKLLVEE